MKTKLSYKQEVTLFFLILAGIFGAALRIYPPAQVDFPLVDGGMFYAMIGDLQAARYALPEFTTYNQSNIPFAYPPLGFYLTGIINSMTNISLFSLLHWLPAIITIAALPAFYYSAKAILQSDSQAALAAFLFSLTPNSYWWNIVGGGLTRSLGTLFFIITVLCVHQMYAQRKKRWAAAAIFSASAVVLSHPAWALHAVLISFLLFLFMGKDKQGMLYSAAIVLGVLCLTSAWWLTVVRHHGLDIFLHTRQDAYSPFRFLTVLFTLSFTDEYAPALAVFGMCGLFLHLAKKEYFLPAWVFLSLLADARSGIPVSIFAFSMMSATFITDGIAPHLAADLSKETLAPATWMRALKTRAGRLFFGFFILLFVYNAFQTSYTLSFQFVTEEERRAMEWVKQNTLPSDRFLVLDENTNPVTSPLTEWFPALTNRKSIGTIQGAEWLAEEQNFSSRYATTSRLLKCVHETVECLNRAQPEIPRYEYIMLSIPGGSSPLGSALKQNNSFELVYSSSSVMIFQVKE